MPDRLYDWKRFWCPRGGEYRASEGGFLTDPDTKWGRAFSPNAFPFEEIAAAQCLILLGEPGLGKSRSLESEQEGISTHAGEPNGVSLIFDLRSYGSEDRLVRNLFESRAFTSWVAGDYQLHLFLDSLDECLLRIDTLAMLLIDELKKYPIERLHLRIASRTAVWPISLEEGLRRLWGKDRVAVYELLPLRRTDVAEAARANHIAPEAFLDEVARVGVVPLAAKPVTLNFLLNTYRETEQLPRTQRELYEQGCRILCEETNPGRRDARLMGDFTADQKMVVAARIAAVTVFANRYAVWTGLNLGDVPEADVTLRELQGGVEAAAGNEFHVNEAAVQETLATGLFSSRGPQRMGWAHQTYAEFLAAWYLVYRGLGLTQMMSLIAHPGDPDGKLVPQLHEVSAWLAGMSPDVFREIRGVEPEVLLRSDVTTAAERERAALVGTLLSMYDEGKLLDGDYSLRERYKKLAHPGLAEQLRPYILDQGKGIVVRRVAADIAEACRLQVLENALVEVALDPANPEPIRVNAAYAVVRIGDDETKARLKPLATGTGEGDPNDDLKGCGLKATWPTHLSATELFGLLTEPKRDLASSAYEEFLGSDFINGVRPEEMPVALRWVAAQDSRHILSYRFNRIMDAIMRRAWEHLEIPEVLESFARAVRSRLVCLDPIVAKRDAFSDIFEPSNTPTFEGIVSNDDEKRRRVIKALVSLASSEPEGLRWLDTYRNPFLSRQDFFWLIEQLLAAASIERQFILARLIRRLFDADPDQVRAVESAKQNSAVLSEVFSPYFRVIELDSDEARLLRAEYQELQEVQARVQPPTPLDPPPAEWINQLLQICESSDSAAWWRLCEVLTLEPNSTHWGNVYENDVTTLPGWKSADDETKRRIIAAARKYLMEQDPAPREWLGKNLVSWTAKSGYKALVLLLREDHSLLSSLADEVWARWAPVILEQPISTGREGEETDDQNDNRELVRIACQSFRQAIIDGVLLLIDYGEYPLDRVEDCWDDALAGALLNRLEDRRLKPYATGHILRYLLSHNGDQAKAFAEGLVALPLPSDEVERARAVIAGHALLTVANELAWESVWPAIRADVDFGHHLVAKVAGSERRKKSVGDKLNEEQLADLYTWLVGQYPYRASDDHVGYGSVPGSSPITLRDSLLRQLIDRGTPEACDAIQRIMTQLPGLDWMKWHLQEAQAIARRKTWVPPQPEEIIKLTGDRRRRLVQNGEQLLEAVIDSLARLEEKLQGETPAVFDLWSEIKWHQIKKLVDALQKLVKAKDRKSIPDSANPWKMLTPKELNRKVYVPKDENGLSNYVKRHLEEDLRDRGIVVNREVEIRPSERTDLHVDAITRGAAAQGYDVVTLIIESKGCWNPELDSAMKSQLADRYLRNNPGRSGLYLVGWFNCKLWDDRDPKKKAAPKLTLEEARQRYNQQAAGLSQRAAPLRALVLNTALPDDSN
jgi:hypothetical protein